MRSSPTCRTAVFRRPALPYRQPSQLAQSLSYSSRDLPSPSIQKHATRQYEHVRQQARLYSCACSSKPRRRIAYIALGSNLGDRVAEIEKACRMMDERGIKVKRTSSLWETKPMYVEDQNHFINGACEVSTMMAIFG